MKISVVLLIGIFTFVTCQDQTGAQSQGGMTGGMGGMTGGMSGGSSGGMGGGSQGGMGGGSSGGMGGPMGAMGQMMGGMGGGGGGMSSAWQYMIRQFMQNPQQGIAAINSIANAMQMAARFLTPGQQGQQGQMGGQTRADPFAMGPFPMMPPMMAGRNKRQAPEIMINQRHHGKREVPQDDWISRSKRQAAHADVDLAGAKDQVPKKQ